LVPGFFAMPAVPEEKRQLPTRWRGRPRGPRAARAFEPRRSRAPHPMEASLQTRDRYAGSAGHHRLPVGSNGMVADRPLAWLLAAALLVANWPYTLLGIMPTNKILTATEPTRAGPDSRALIEKWAALHAGRTALGFAATLAFLWASMS
jgi:hypothetical protein